MLSLLGLRADQRVPAARQVMEGLGCSSVAAGACETTLSAPVRRGRGQVLSEGNAGVARSRGRARFSIENACLSAAGGLPAAEQPPHLSASHM